MKKLLLLLLLQPFSLVLGVDIDVQLLEGTWYRTYGIYRPWTDDNQGTFSYYEEELIFHANGIVFIYDNSSEELQGKSVFTILQRDNKQFIVFHKPDQDPKNDIVQKQQGFFVILEQDNDDFDVLTLTTVKESKKRKPSSVSYKKIKKHAKEPQFIVPRNKQ
jgi:hypothetical protein